VTAKQKDQDQPLVHGTEQAQKTMSKEDEQGFRGVKVDPFPNSAHSLESGPDSPTVAETAAAVAKASS
jgi:hypothetical protein